jgi:hypothetical protein
LFWGNPCVSRIQSREQGTTTIIQHLIWTGRHLNRSFAKVQKKRQKVKRFIDEVKLDPAWFSQSESLLCSQS